MDPDDSTRSALPPASIVIPSAFFFVLTYLTNPPWHGIEASPHGYLILAISQALPLIVLAAPNLPKGRWLVTAIFAASFSSVFLCFHAGISRLVVADLDAGEIVGASTVTAALGVFTGAVAVPVGLLVSRSAARGRLSVYIFVPAAFGALGQALFFTGIRMWEGATGIGLWMESRIAIHAVFGLVAGLFMGSAKLYRPKMHLSKWGGFSSLSLVRLPGASILSTTLICGLFLFGCLRVAIETGDRTRLIETRLDEYFLALSNLRRAQMESLSYPGLSLELDRAGRALGGSASYDPTLKRLVSSLAVIIEETRQPMGNQEFQNAAMALNRHLLSLGEPYFLEPQVLVEGPLPFRFLLRYRVSGQARYRIEGGGSVPLLRLRRLDRSLVDTPYTGLSYAGVGTVLMDHIDEVVLKSYGILFDPKNEEENPADGKFAATRRLMRQDRITALKQALGSFGYTNQKALEGLAEIGAAWAQVADTSGARVDMTPKVRATYDALTEILARQTEVHEARHAFDGEWKETPKRLEELDPGKLGPSAASELRAYLTEIIDGPLGPRFALTSAAKAVAGPNARSNAYFFAGVVLLETLWQERIRRPDVLERESEKGPVHVFAHITPKHPGWLSYSRIHGAYDDLRKLPKEELKIRARQGFELLFGEEYKRIYKQR